jgi:hypothetical protein
MIKARAVLVFALLSGTIVSLIGCGQQSCLTEAEELGLNTVTIGTTRYGDLYEFGVILVRYEYEQEPVSTTDIPVAAVKDFFLKKGYSPKVIGRASDLQIVTIGKDTDPSPLLKELKTVPGVNAAELNYLISTAELLVPVSDDLPEVATVRPTFRTKQIEVFKTEDGFLYEPGVVLVQYNNTITLKSANTTRVPVAAVNNFLVNKGYMPRLRGTLPHFEVIEVGKCVDPTPLLEGLKEIPGVVDARLNRFRSSIEILSGEPIIPNIAL